MQKKHKKKVAFQYEPPILIRMVTNLTVNGESTKCFDIELDGLNFADYPDFCDAFIASASKLNASGEAVELTREELESVPSEEVYELVWDKLC